MLMNQKKKKKNQQNPKYVTRECGGLKEDLRVRMTINKKEKTQKKVINKYSVEK